SQIDRASRTPIARGVRSRSEGWTALDAEPRLPRECRKDAGSVPMTRTHFVVSCGGSAGSKMVVRAVMREPLPSLLSGKLQRNTRREPHHDARKHQKSAARCQDSRYNNREKNPPKQG